MFGAVFNAYSDSAQKAQSAEIQRQQQGTSDRAGTGNTTGAGPNTLEGAGIFGRLAQMQKEKQLTSDTLQQVADPPAKIGPIFGKIGDALLKGIASTDVPKREQPTDNPTPPTNLTPETTPDIPSFSLDSGIFKPGGKGGPGGSGNAQNSSNPKNGKGLEGKNIGEGNPTRGDKVGMSPSDGPWTRTAYNPEQNPQQTTPAGTPWLSVILMGVGVLGVVVVLSYVGSKRG